MWKKTKRCDSNLCVVVSVGSTAVWLGDGTQGGRRPVLSVPTAAYVDLIDAVRSGQLVKP